MRQPRRKPAHGRCPSEAEIELLVLTDSPAAARSAGLAGHIDACPRCRAIARELSRFYDLLLSSLSAPVSACVLDYVFHRTLDVKEVAHFALRPVCTQVDGARVFRCEQVGRIPGEALEDAVKDFAARVLAGGDAGLYALNTEHAAQLLLFLWVPNDGRSCATITFPGLGKSSMLSRYGMAVLDRVQISDLEAQEVYLQPLPSPNSAALSRIDMITNAIQAHKAPGQ
ncbi:MAG: hypothetical protein QHJ34_10785 [bacterium]|jgi:hypothetical protein|nr:hypothetical protein [candidate division KSB1 bacterium]MDH7560699.1 hypothetical protein [bacterium]